MKLPDAVKAIRSRYVAKFAVPQTPGGGDAHEERCRQWSIRFAEQVAFDQPGQGWGVKKAAGPISKDTIARQLDGKLIVWDLLVGTGTGTPVLNTDPDGEEVQGQTFVSVTPTNHVDGGAPLQPEIPPETPSPALAARIAALEAQTTALRGEIGRLTESVATLTTALDTAARAIDALGARRFRVVGRTGKSRISLADGGNHDHDAVSLSVEVIP
jgi:hypothetical protein